MLTGKASDFHTTHVIGSDNEDDFGVQYWRLKLYFEHKTYREHYYTYLTTASFTQMRTDNPSKSLQEVLAMLLDKLQLCQRALGYRFGGEETLHMAVTTACKGVPELAYAL